MRPPRHVSALLLASFAIGSPIVLARCLYGCGGMIAQDEISADAGEDSWRAPRPAVDTYPDTQPPPFIGGGASPHQCPEHCVPGGGRPF